MRRKALFVSTVVVAVAAAGSAAGAAQAHPDARVAQTQSHQAARHITVVERAVSDTVVDLGATGDSLGDQLTFGNPVYDRTNSHKVGRDQGSDAGARPAVLVDGGPVPWCRGHLRPPSVRASASS